MARYQKLLDANKWVYGNKDAEKVLRDAKYWVHYMEKCITVQHTVQVRYEIILRFASNFQPMVQNHATMMKRKLTIMLTRYTYIYKTIGTKLYMDKIWRILRRLDYYYMKYYGLHEMMMEDIKKTTDFVEENRRGQANFNILD